MASPPDTTPDVPQDHAIPTHPPITNGLTNGVRSDSIETEAVAEEIREAHTITIEASPFARGGHADVFDGQWLPPGNTEKIRVAVKVLRFAGMAGTDEEKDRLIRIDKRLGREMRVWQRLRCPGRIVPLLGYMRSSNGIIVGEYPCLVSPFYAKKNLNIYLQECPGADRLELLAQAAEGLCYLHALEPCIVHLDIKAENILINDDGEAEICDFGVARILDGIVTGLTTSGNAACTFNYACPEILENDKEAVTPAADVWSFACVVLDVLSGKPPFYKIGSSVLKITMAIATGKTARRVDHDIPMPSKSVDSLWDLFGRCWEIEPPDRPTMVQVMGELREINDSK